MEFQINVKLIKKTYLLEQFISDIANQEIRLYSLDGIDISALDTKQPVIDDINRIPISNEVKLEPEHSYLLETIDSEGNKSFTLIGGRKTLQYHQENYMKKSYSIEKIENEINQSMQGLSLALFSTPQLIKDAKNTIALYEKHFGETHEVVVEQKQIIKNLEKLQEESPLIIEKNKKKLSQLNNERNKLEEQANKINKAIFYSFPENYIKQEFTVTATMGDFHVVDWFISKAETKKPIIEKGDKAEFYHCKYVEKSMYGFPYFRIFYNGAYANLDMKGKKNLPISTENTFRFSIEVPKIGKYGIYTRAFKIVNHTNSKTYIFNLKILPGADEKIKPNVTVTHNPDYTPQSLELNLSELYIYQNKDGATPTKYRFEVKNSFGIMTLDGQPINDKGWVNQVSFTKEQMQNHKLRILLKDNSEGQLIHSAAVGIGQLDSDEKHSSFLKISTSNGKVNY